MFQILYKYLILNKQVSIPGIGLFQVVQSPASLDYANKVIHSPLPVIKFTDTNSSADKSFFQFASRELHAEEVDTIRQFHDFSYQLKHDVNTHKTIELPGMGLLIKNNFGELNFEPANVLNEYFPATKVEWLLHEDPQQLLPAEIETAETQDSDNSYDEVVVVKKDRWWIAAIVMAVLGIAAIVYYYYTNPIQ